MSNPGAALQASEAAPDSLGTAPRRPSRLLFVRHGQSTWNDEHRIQGQLDPPLSERGQGQARAVAERLAGVRPVAFYTSDLRRCRETAEPIAERIGLQPTPLAELREVALGEWEGRTREELERDFPEEWERWARHPSWDIVPGGEGAAAFERRVETTVRELFERHPQGDILAVTHGGVIQVKLGLVAGRGSDGIFPFVIDNASLTIVRRTGERLVVTAVNDTCHLS